MDSEILTKMVCMIDRLNKSYSELGELVAEIDKYVSKVVLAHDIELTDHRKRIQFLEDDMIKVKKVVGL